MNNLKLYHHFLYLIQEKVEIFKQLYQLQIQNLILINHLLKNCIRLIFFLYNHYYF